MEVLLAEKPSNDEKLQLALSVFRNLKSRSGDSLIPNNFFAYAATHRLSAKDVMAGVNLGVELGWFLSGPNGTIVLTDMGFAKV
jgi:F0F1-type ATP synthase assembly protein I